MQSPPNKDSAINLTTVATSASFADKTTSKKTIPKLSEKKLGTGEETPATRTQKMATFYQGNKRASLSFHNKDGSFKNANTVMIAATAT